MSKNQPQIKKKLLCELERVPIIQVACQRVGISRSTFYRWVDVDEEFADKVSSSIEKGIDIINDMAESKLISAIKEDKHSAIVFWLRHNSYKYRPSYLNKGRKKPIWERQPLKTIVHFVGGNNDSN